MALFWFLTFPHCSAHIHRERKSWREDVKRRLRKKQKYIPSGNQSPDGLRAAVLDGSVTTPNSLKLSDLGRSRLALMSFPRCDPQSSESSASVSWLRRDIGVTAGNKTTVWRRSELGRDLWSGRGRPSAWHEGKSTDTTRGSWRGARRTHVNVRTAEKEESVLPSQRSCRASTLGNGPRPPRRWLGSTCDS